MPYRDPADQLSAWRKRYATNPKYKAYILERKAEYRERNQRYAQEIKAKAACTDCGVSYPPWVMQFDHLGEDKDDAVSNLVKRPVSLVRLMAEIAKCEIVCANCHAERTHQRLVGNLGVGPSN